MTADRHDAAQPETAPRLNTGAVLRFLAGAGNERPFMAFRSGNGGRILIGQAGTNGVLTHRAALPDFARRSDQLAAAGRTLFGFTAYECFNDIGRQNEAWPLAVLAEATLVLATDGDNCRPLTAADTAAAAELAAQLPATAPTTNTEHRAVTDDDRYWPTFLERLRKIRDWAQTNLGKHRRLTISRTIHIADDIDPVATFLGYQPSDLARAFLFRHGSLLIVGQSPELLIDGNLQKFSTFKLSGTAPRSDDELADDALLQDMLESRKLRDEHEGSILATEMRLGLAGPVERSAKFIQTLPQLRHFVTRLEVANTKGLGLWGVLNAASPSGAHPAEEALALLRMLETRPRGPYYGLIGYAEGGEHLHFAQTIRSLFNSGRDGWFTRVGAAVTEDSLPRAELEETRTKLRNISYCAHTRS